MTERMALVATDFSADARRAARRVARLCADGVFTRGRLLHVIQRSWIDVLRRLMDLPAEQERALLEDARMRLDAEAALIAEDTGFLLEAGVRIGAINQAVQDEATSADLLALGAHGLHPLRDFAIGTTAEHLLRQADTPLLIVRADPGGAYSTVLVATDFSVHAQHALRLACMIAPTATIHVRHVYELPFEGMLQFAGLNHENVAEFRSRAHADAAAEMQRFITTTGIDPARVHTTLSSAEHIPTALHETTKLLGADLVVVGKHGRNIAENLLLGSVTLHLLAESSCDVLVAM